MKLKFLQEGGQMAPEAAPAEQDPMVQIIQMAQQALEAQDGNMALQVCDALVQMAQQAAPAPAGPEGGEPEPAPEGEPVFGKGGKLLRRV